MSEALTIKRATRQGVIPLISLYSESGCGKTFSSLLLARGLAGSSGHIVMVDTESRRGSLYADVLPGGYEVIDLDAPFTPARYIEALTIAFASKPACVVIDSMSHEWEGIGGVCDAAAENEARSGKTGLHCWKQPKFEHAKLVQFLLRSPVPLICCIRAKHKTRQKKDDKGKTVIVKDESTSPIQAEDFIYESTCHAEILPDHSINLTKASHPGLRDCFPKTGPITVKHGELIRAWCQMPGGASRANGSLLERHEADPLRPLKAKLWDMLKDMRGPKENPWGPIEHQLANWNIIAPGQKIPALSAEELTIVTDKVELQLQPELTP